MADQLHPALNNDLKNKGNNDLSRGGKRPNSGRKKGKRNERTQELIVKAAETGEMPLDMMLRYMRGEGYVWKPKIGPDGLPMYIMGDDEKKVAVMEWGPMSERDRLELAKWCAPFLHARLQSIEQTPAPPDLSHIPDADLERLANLKREQLQILTRAATGLGVDRSGSPSAKARQRS